MHNKPKYEDTIRTREYKTYLHNDSQDTFNVFFEASTNKSKQINASMFVQKFTQ